MLSSIRARTTAVFVIAVVMLMSLAIGGQVFYARRAAERSADVALQSTLVEFKREISDEPKSSLSELIDEEQEDFIGKGVSFFIVGDDGHIIRAPNQALMSAQLDDPQHWRIIRLRVGEEWLVVALPWAKTEASLRSLANSLMLLGLVVVFVSTLGAWLLVGRTLSPIGRLTAQANQATIDGLRVRLKEPSHDTEIVGLVDTLNGLLARLSEAAAAKGRFYSAASHELRTPLQALSGHLELALNKDRTPEDYREAIKEAYQQTSRLIKLTRSLLLLYQLESDSSPPVERCDLTAVCRSTLDELNALSENRHIRLSIELPEQAVFTASTGHAEVLVRNLVENALRYTDPEGNANVRVESNPDRLTLSVFNECSLRSDWSAEQFFEPFMRLDASRNAATGGTGLGLTICKAIAEINGWDLSLTKEPRGVSAVLTIRL